MSYSSQFLKDADLLDKFGFHELAEKIEKLAFINKRIVTAAEQQIQKPGKFNFVADQSKKDEVNKNHINLIYQKVIQSGCDISYYSADFFSLLGTLKYVPIINTEQDISYNQDHDERFHRIAESIEKKDAHTLLLACFFKKQKYNTGGYKSFNDQFKYKIARLNDIHGFSTGRRLDFKDAIYFYEASVNPNASKNVFANRVLPSMNDFLDLLFEKFKFDPLIHNETAESLYKINYIFGPRSLEYIKKFSPEIDLNDTEQKLDSNAIHDPAQRLPLNYFQPQGIAGETIPTESGTALKETETKDGYDTNVTGMGNFILANSVNNFQTRINELDLSIVSNENKENEVRKALINFLKPYETLDYWALTRNTSKIITEFDEKYSRILKKSISQVIAYLFENLLDNSNSKILNSWDKKVLIDDGEYPIRQLIGRFSFEEIYAIIDTDTLLRAIGIENIKDMEFARAFLKYGEYGKNSTYYFQIAQDLYLNNPDKEPNWAGKIVRSGNLTGRILPKSDKRFLFVGNITGCCQKLDGAARNSCHDSMENPYSSIFVIENSNGRILAQSYVWEDKNGKIVFDSFETKNKDAEFNIDCYNIIKEISQEFSTDVYIGSWNSARPEELNEKQSVRSTFLEKHNYETYAGDSSNVKPLKVEIKDSYDLMKNEDFVRVSELIHMKYLKLSAFKDEFRFAMLAQHIADTYGSLKFDDVKDLGTEYIDVISKYIQDSYNNVVEYAINSSIVKNFKDDAKKYLQMQQWNLEGLKDLQMRQDDFVGQATYTPTTLFVVYENETVPNKSYINYPLSGIMTLIANSAAYVGATGKTKYDISEFNKYGIYFNRATESSIIAIHSSMKIPKSYDLENYGHLIESSRDPNNIKELLADENGNIKKSSKLDSIFETILTRNLNLDFIMDCGYVFLKNPLEGLSNTSIIGILDASTHSYSYSDLLSRNIIIPKDSTAGLGLMANDSNHSESLTEVQKVVYADKSFKEKWTELEQLGVDEPWKFLDEHIRVYGGKYQNEDAYIYLNYKTPEVQEWNRNFPMDVSKCEDFIRNWLRQDNKWDFLNLVYQYGFQYKESNFQRIEEIYKEKFPTADQGNMTEETL